MREWTITVGPQQVKQAPALAEDGAVGMPLRARADPGPHFLTRKRSGDYSRFQYVVLFSLCPERRGKR